MPRPDKVKLFGFQATNKCCRDWLLLGWPAGPGGRYPDKIDVAPVFTSECPKCHGQIHFDLAHPDIDTDTDQWAALLERLGIELRQEAISNAMLVGGRIRVP